MNRLAEVFSVWIVSEICLRSVSASAQLDLPPISPHQSVVGENVGRAKARVLPNSYAVKILGSEEETSGDEDRSDAEPDGRGDSTDFDRDRNLRYGPPYTDENNRQFYRGNYNNDGDNFYNRSYGGYRDDGRYSADRSPNTNPGDGDDRYYANRNRYADGEEKYYDQRGRDGYRNNYGGSDDDKYYSDRNSPRDPADYDRGRYGGRYNPQVMTQFSLLARGADEELSLCQQNYDDRPGYGPNDYHSNERPYFEDERARLEEERRARIEEANLKRLLAEVDGRSSSECSLNVGAQWHFETNVNEATQQEAVKPRFHPD